MPQIVVIFTTGPNSARDDLRQYDPDVRAAVCRLATQVLRKDLDPKDDDEQVLPKQPWKIRRAITQEDAQTLRNTAELESSDALQAHDVWYVFRDCYPAEISHYGGREGFVVARLIDTEQFGYLASRGWNGFHYE